MLFWAVQCNGLHGGSLQIGKSIEHVAVSTIGSCFVPLSRFICGNRNWVDVVRLSSSLSVVHSKCSLHHTTDGDRPFEEREAKRDANVTCN